MQIVGALPIPSTTVPVLTTLPPTDTVPLVESVRVPAFVTLPLPLPRVPVHVPDPLSITAAAPPSVPLTVAATIVEASLALVSVSDPVTASPAPSASTPDTIWLPVTVTAPAF